jgi:uncharacterized protein (TIGR03790 family)
MSPDDPAKLEGFHTMTRLLAPALFALALVAMPAHALAPAEIWIVANKNVADSKAVAEYYCLKRGVPKANIIYLDLTANEDISRASYDANLVKPLRTALNANKSKVKLLLTVYGVPLRVGPTTPSAAELAEATKLQSQRDILVKQRDEVYAKITALSPQATSDPTIAKQVTDLKTLYNQLVAQIAAIDTRLRWLRHTDAVASVDSELSTLWWPTYDVRRYQLNRLYFRIPATQAVNYQPVVMTCRLDGPTAAIARGLVDKALAAESKGLAGKAYFDARGLKYDATADPTGSGHGAMDESIREAAALFQKANVATVLDNKFGLFAAGSCPDSAIYCGWYSHAKYIASNKFVPGAIGYHIASSECVSLRRVGATFWCKRMLEDGITATLGPVAEPYVFTFPRPAEFYGMLGTGATLADSYWLTSRYTSWMMVLLGDPLYRPYVKAPKWKLEAVKASPAGSR